MLLLLPLTKLQRLRLLGRMKVLRVLGIGRVIVTRSLFAGDIRRRQGRDHIMSSLNVHLLGTPSPGANNLDRRRGHLLTPLGELACCRRV
jgi:hypothetical protein